MSNYSFPRNTVARTTRFISSDSKHLDKSIDLWKPKIFYEAYYSDCCYDSYTFISKEIFMYYYICRPLLVKTEPSIRYYCTKISSHGALYLKREHQTTLIFISINQQVFIENYSYVINLIHVFIINT